MTIILGQYLPPNVLYNISFVGLAIDSGQIGYLIRVETRDPSDEFVIEYDEVLMTTSTDIEFAIEVNEIYFEFVNPDVFTTMRLKFYIPRALYDDEKFYLYLGSDLTDQNRNTNRLTLHLYTYGVTPVVELPITFNFDGNRFLLSINRDQFLSGEYELTIDGVMTPAGNVNDLMTLTYVRDYDLTVTLTNLQDTTVTFPDIQEGYTSNVLLYDGYAMEGIPSYTVLQVQLVNV